jgi:hypothetical protein
MTYIPAGRQQDNSILSQIMKYDKSVQPAQSYTNVSQQWTPYGRMEDWETLARGLGKGIGATMKNVKEGAYKGTYDPREEGYKWAPGKLAAAAVGAPIAGIKNWLAKRKEEAAAKKAAGIEEKWQQKVESDQYTPEEWEAESGQIVPLRDATEAGFHQKTYGAPFKILTDEQKRARGPRRTEARVALQKMEGWDQLSREEQQRAIDTRAEAFGAREAEGLKPDDEGFDKKQYGESYPDFLERTQYTEGSKGYVGKHPDILKEEAQGRAAKIQEEQKSQAAAMQERGASAAKAEAARVKAAALSGKLQQGRDFQSQQDIGRMAGDLPFTRAQNLVAKGKQREKQRESEYRSYMQQGETSGFMNREKWVERAKKDPKFKEWLLNRGLPYKQRRKYAEKLLSKQEYDKWWEANYPG